MPNSAARWLPRVVTGPARPRDLAWPTLHVALFTWLAYSWLAPPPYYPYLGFWFDLFGVPSIIGTALVVNVVLVVRGVVRWNRAVAVGITISTLTAAIGVTSGICLVLLLASLSDF